jgi:hypothetical protein
MEGIQARKHVGVYERRFGVSTRGLAWARGATTVLAVILSLGLSVGAAGAGEPTRPLATVYATQNHAPFPLVSADSGGEVRLRLDELADRDAHFYVFMVGDMPVEFFVVWAHDNVVRTAFNACDVCYRAKLGYRQDGEVMVCSNCGSRFPVERIGTVAGGCNPASFAARVEGQELVISAAVLAAGLTYFL